MFSSPSFSGTFDRWEESGSGGDGEEQHLTTVCRCTHLTDFGMAFERTAALLSAMFADPLPPWSEAMALVIFIVGGSLGGFAFIGLLSEVSDKRWRGELLEAVRRGNLHHLDKKRGEAKEVAAPQAAPAKQAGRDAETTVSRLQRQISTTLMWGGKNSMNPTTRKIYQMRRAYNVGASNGEQYGEEVLR